MSSLAYINNDYARGYVASRTNRRKGVHVPLAFVDICEGNLYDAMMFSQLMYWHEPSQETGETRMRREHDGHLWVAKNHGDWYSECRVKASTARKCIDRLKNLGLIHYELHGEKGNVTPYIRINWDRFAELMQAWETGNIPENVINITDTREHTPATTGQGGLIRQDTPLLPEVDSNTESTTESTSKVKDTPDLTEPEPEALPVTVDADGFQAKVGLLRDVGVLSTSDFQRFKVDADDYTLDQWQRGVDRLKERRKANGGYKGYGYLMKIMPDIEAEDKQAAVIEAEKPAPTTFILTEPVKRWSLTSDYLPPKTGESA